jgi:toxin ParE1/3/4
MKEPGLGERFAAAVEEATARAFAYPQAGTPATKDTRRVFLKDFPFAVVFRPDTEGITIFALAHHSRRPGYWRSRVKDS